MKHLTILSLVLLLLAIAAPPSRAEWKKIESVTEANVGKLHPALLAACREACAKGRYLNGDHPKRPSIPALPGWESAWKDPRLLEQDYVVSDKKTGTSKAGRVIVYNPSPELFAAWVANAIMETSADQATPDEDLALRFVHYVWGHSGVQFPVIGLVWEDQAGAKDRHGDDTGDGINEAYPFLDGITVRKSPKMYYQENGVSRRTKKFEEPELAAGLHLDWTKGTPGTYGRIAGTTRDMIQALAPKLGEKPPVGDAGFVEYIRTRYIAAMTSPRNELLVARLIAYRGAPED